MAYTVQCLCLHPKHTRTHACVYKQKHPQLNMSACSSSSAHFYDVFGPNTLCYGRFAFQVVLSPLSLCDIIGASGAVA